VFNLDRGLFAFLSALGFTVNLLTALSALVLAIGIVVDERHRDRGETRPTTSRRGNSPRIGTAKAMDEVSKDRSSGSPRC